MLRLVPHGESTVTISVDAIYNAARSFLIVALLLFALYQAYMLGKIAAKIETETDATFVR